MSDSTAKAVSRSARKVALLQKMTADRALLLTATHVEDLHALSRPGISGTLARLGNSDSFIGRNALPLTAALVGLLVIGPRRAIWSAARIAGPTLLSRGVRTLLSDLQRGN
jgi:hypothetical protein